MINQIKYFSLIVGIITLFVFVVIGLVNTTRLVFSIDLEGEEYEDDNIAYFDLFAMKLFVIIMIILFVISVPYNFYKHGTSMNRHFVNNTSTHYHMTPKKISLPPPPPPPSVPESP